jgi:hypothetical protein
MDRRDLPRQLALVAVITVAALLVLLGARSLYRSVTQDGGPVPGVEVTHPPAALAPTGTPATGPLDPSGEPAPSATPSSTGPASTPPDEPRILAAGDIAACDSDGDEATAALLDALPGTIITLGDTVYPSATEATFRDCFDPSWGRHRDRIRPIAGNHDWDTGDLAAYLDYFGDAAVNEDGDPWYADDVGTWQVIALASDCARVDGCDSDSPQGRWLADTLAASDARCTLAVFHHPRFSSGEHGPTEAVAPLWEQLHAAGVDVVLNGHEHDYERFGPQDPSGIADPERGIRQFIVGTGGIDLRPFQRVAANSELRASVAHGVLELTLKDGAYDWTFHAVGDAFVDRGTAFCH